jgi:phosphoribosylaminoimidazolecarboxamide formyltransferase / IMP cyclohydrolase
MDRIHRALISVTDKTGIIEFAQSLRETGIEIVSTGGTAKIISRNNIPVVEVSSFTGFPEMLDGRVKTLNPRIHAGILFKRDMPDHHAQMEAHQLSPIDLVCVNLYPFEATVANPDVALDEAIENIDIGGPTLLRAAAKNFSFVTAVVDPADYDDVIKEIKENQGQTRLETRFKLAKKVFAQTSHYDGAISRWLDEVNIRGIS